MKAKILIILIAATSLSCEVPKEMKKVKWSGYEIYLYSLDGDATTSYYRKVKVRKLDDDRNSLIFESYSSPHLTNIFVKNNQLGIVCSGYKDQKDTISIDLKYIQDFIEEPIKYHRHKLLSTNRFYQEPTFLKLDRDKYGF